MGTIMHNQRLACQILSGIVAALVVACGSSPTGHHVAGSFTGTIDEIVGEIVLDDAAFAVGSPVTGLFHWDLPELDEVSDPNIGLYKLQGRVNVTAPGLGGNTSGSFHTEVYDNSHLGTRDRWFVKAVGVVADFSLSGVDLTEHGTGEITVELDLRDSAGNLLAGDELPTTIDVSQMTSGRFAIHGSGFHISGPVETMVLEEKNAP